MNDEPRPRRARRSRRIAKIAERASSALITIGGIGTILAVTMIFFFLLAVVVPLLLGASAGTKEVVAATASRARPLLAGVDGDGLQAWSLDPNGILRLWRTDTGELLRESSPFGEAAPVCASSSLEDDSVFVGFADGSVRAGRAGFDVEIVEPIPEELEQLEPGAYAAWSAGIAQRTPQGQIRLTTFQISVEQAVVDAGGEPVLLVDHSRTTQGIIAATCARTHARLYEIVETENMMTGKLTRRVKKSVDLPGLLVDGKRPVRLLVSDLGQAVYLACEDGTTTSVDTLDPENPERGDAFDLLPEDGVRLTSLEFMIGKRTLVAGDSRGRVRAWFQVREDEDGSEVRRMRMVHDLPSSSSPVTDLDPSTRTRLLAAAYESGDVRLFQVTTEQEIVGVKASGPVRRVVLAPKEDRLVTWTDHELATWSVDVRYPEASMAALFTPIWYENYDRPEQVWQSSSGTDDFEPKLGLVPLVFGTLKATVYSMVFGAPLALLAALFTSEFLAKRLRTTVKSTIELMASLPSVVLGFLAAMVIAPFVRSLLPATLVALLTVPVALLVGAYVWQLLPQRISVRLGGTPRLAVIAFTCLGIGIPSAVLLGPLWERVFFSGDVEGWLDGRVGRAMGGWFYLLLPVSGLLVALVSGRVATPRLAARSKSWSRERLALADLLKFGAGLGLTVVVALAFASLLDVAGADPRGHIVGTYVQLNALIVGFVMGFAIIPIIYTLAENALSEVPGHLREASLGAGATPWQTAVRIVIPTGMSGLFSAMMVGLGRAVGETMIVLMAAGNTPIMDWSPFNGFRTLSANIAYELPEAVPNSAHYRTLFLAALVLFAMTFVVNTVAEAVRRRFRRKAQAL